MLKSEKYDVVVLKGEGGRIFLKYGNIVNTQENQ